MGLRSLLAVALFCSLASLLHAADALKIIPTTTLAAETGNNTSAANTFAGTGNGNLPAGNVSKLPLRSLLYSGAATKLYAHDMPWWGESSHANIGYNSNDPVEVASQVTDMISRGLDGAVVDWYGPGSFEDGASQVFAAEVGRHPNFGLIIEIEHGAVLWHSCYPTCDSTTAFIQLANSVASLFYSSPAYVKLNGQPVLMEFGMELVSVDWTRVAAALPGIIILHRNTGGFTQAGSGGGFAWNSPDTLATEPAGYDGTSYLIDFYKKAAKYPSLQTYGSVYKGFNDTLASWAPPGGRHIEQNCGQTWLRTFNEINAFYSPSNPLDALQLVTWNDYEEGTALEVGIDNCFSLTAGVAGSVLGWSIAGDESTVDHYTVFVSTDGQNLMSLGDFPAGTRALDLSSFSLGPASYTMYVKATGKPSIRNQMSAAASYTVVDRPPVAVLSLTPQSGKAPLNVAASTAGSTAAFGSIAASTINFGDGTVATSQPASHVYSKAGAYSVTATVTDAYGMSAQTVAVVNVINQPPVALLSLSASTGVAPFTISASTAGSSDADGSIASVKIDFGDGPVATSAAASHLYTKPGSYVVKATVTDNMGASTTVSQTVTIAPGVTITAPLQGAKSSSPVRITATASAYKPITSMIIYVDNVNSFLIYASSLNTTLKMNPGQHTILIKAWDNTGTIYRNSVTITSK